MRYIPRAQSFFHVLVVIVKESHGIFAGEMLTHNGTSARLATTMVCIDVGLDSEVTLILSFRWLV